jgi:hypothetical protein
MAVSKQCGAPFQALLVENNSLTSCTARRTQQHNHHYMPGHHTGLPIPWLCILVLLITDLSLLDYGMVVHLFLLLQLLHLTFCSHISTQHTSTLHCTAASAASPPPPPAPRGQLPCP